MGFWARAKSEQGGRVPLSITVASGSGDQPIPDWTNSLIVDGASGGSTITTLNANGRIFPGRTVTLRGKNGMTGSVTFNTNNFTTTKGQMDLLTNGAARTIADNEVIKVQQHANGAWSIVDNQPANAP